MNRTLFYFFCKAILVCNGYSVPHVLTTEDGHARQERSSHKCSTSCRHAPSNFQENQSSFCMPVTKTKSRRKPTKSAPLIAEKSILLEKKPVSIIPASEKLDKAISHEQLFIPPRTEKLPSSIPDQPVLQGKTPSDSPLIPISKETVQPVEVFETKESQPNCDTQNKKLETHKIEGTGNFSFIDSTNHIENNHHFETKSFEKEPVEVIEPQNSLDNADSTATKIATTEQDAEFFSENTANQMTKTKEQINYLSVSDDNFLQSDSEKVYSKNAPKERLIENQLKKSIYRNIFKSKAKIAQQHNHIDLFKKNKEKDDKETAEDSEDDQYSNWLAELLKTASRPRDLMNYTTLFFQFS